ncbi:MAG: hypothetical protein LC126_04815 [Bryobacterales bacterium]|nr:hypothetical protein [Bryobacterales bacterium]
MWIVLGLMLALPALSQVCRLSVAGLNRNRRVVGAITAECPNPIHSAPFGNWGVTSNFGVKHDGHQFDGWCHNTPICDNAGNCRTDCTDGWYEWNSCTNHDLYKAPNCTLYNSAGCTEQATVTGINVIGTQTVDIPVSCPSTSAGAATYNQGGCNEVRQYSRNNNFLSLYELDPVTGDELVQSVYYPSLLIPLECNAWGCPAAGSEWASPIGWDSPKEPAKVFAEMAMVVNSGAFVDSGNACRVAVLPLRAVSSATLSNGIAAPDSLLTLFTPDVTAATESASGITLPTTLGGVRVTVTDSAGVRRTAPLSYVSPRQINMVVPVGTREGTAAVTVSSGNTARSTGTVAIARVLPGLFTANASGQGTAAAVGIRIDAAGAQTWQLSFECTSRDCTALPLDLGSSSDQYVLALFGTGIRGAGMGTVQAYVGGIPAQVLYAGPQPTLAGLDQVNLLLPKSLAGRGVVDIVLTADGKNANAVTVWIQ